MTGILSFFLFIVYALLIVFGVTMAYRLVVAVEKIADKLDQ